MCGRLLEKKGVDIRSDDENELTDTVRTPGRSPEEEGE
jgi:putative membrane protein